MSSNHSMPSDMTEVTNGMQGLPLPSRQQPPQYTHRPLTAPSEIRILRLEPGTEEDPVQCSLVHTSLDSSPQFEAISYTWGSGPATCPIHCDGQELHLRQNLFDGLVIFRYPDRPRHLWVDAVCINQEDDVEKGNQVHLMSRIYSDAARVLIWLGRGDPSTVKTSLDHIFRFVKCAIPEPLQNDAFKAFGLDENLQADRLKPPLWNGSILDTTDEDLAPLFPFAEVDIRATVMHIFENAYFKRGWIVQEIVLSRTADVFWAHGQIQFLSVCLFALGIYSLGQKPCAAGHAAWAGVNAMRNLYTSYGSQARFQPPPGKSDSILDFIENVRNCDFTDPLDRVYGVLALAESSNARPDGQVAIRPDYGITVAQCYQDVAEELLQGQRGMRLLSCVQHNPGALDPSWPSWVPDWRIDRVLKPVQATLFEFEFGEDEEASPLLLGNPTEIDKQCISVRGSRLGVLAHTAGSGVWKESEERLQSLLRQLTEDYDAGCVGLTATMNTWVLETIKTKKQADEHAEAFERLLGWNFATTSMLDDSSAPAYKDMDPFMMLTLCREHLAGRCFFILEDDTLGLGPDTMQEGDSIVSLGDAQVAFILRPSENGMWRLVGDCFITGDQVASLRAGWEERGKPREDFIIF